jgi:hypothetical protein
MKNKVYQMEVFLGYFFLLVILLTGISNLIVGFLGIPIQFLNFIRDTGNILGSFIFWLSIFHIWKEIYGYTMPLLSIVLIGFFYYLWDLNTQKRVDVPGAVNDLMGQTAGFLIISIGYLIYNGIRYSEFNWI